MKTKYDDLHYREETGEIRNEWLRCKIGRIRMEKRNPKYPAEPVFYVLGFGATMADAEQMVERKLGRAVPMNGDGRLKMGDGT
jgi:hypothetical protein